MRILLALLLLVLLALPGRGADKLAELAKQIQAIPKGKLPASPEARAAWNKLVAAGPAALPVLLDGMDTADTVVANWFRTAFDRVVDTDLKQHKGKNLDLDTLLTFAKEPKHQGRVRRLALELVERFKPGTTAGLLPGWLDDPEFRFDAIEVLIKEADELAKAGKKEKATNAFRRAFNATRDVKQAQQIGSRLKEAGETVSLARHFGFLTDWQVIGPFDAKNQMGFKTVYPPEEKVDLKAEYAGKSGKIKWQPYQVKETLTGLPQRACLVNLLEPLGNAEDAVAYAYTIINVDKPVEAEFRGAADDNLSVWVNGKRAFGFEEYRNGVRLDRHRFRVPLAAGKNSVLVKICQMKEDGTNVEPNWEFLLRVVRPDGERLDFTPAK
ncbi:MAG: hypothetical protein AB7K24_09855 [Gemmataceae bacterium]